MAPLKEYKAKVQKHVAKKAVKKVVIPMKYYTAVGRGIAFLDLVFGRKEWLQKMDMKDFDIEQPDVCVAGNVFRDAMFVEDSDGYDNFMKAMRMIGQYQDDSGERFGFYSESEKGMQYLQDIWVASINKMKKQARVK